MNNKFEILSKPIQVGSITLKNRMVMAPMGLMLWSITGEVTPQAIEYYSKRARGGAALLTLGIVQVHSPEWGMSPCIDDDRYIPGLAKLTGAIHSFNVPIIAQLHHGGPSAFPPISPSGVPVLSANQDIIVPRAMTLEEVEDMRERYIKAAVRAKKSGFDGVQPHGAATYLLQQFFSPKTNIRTDKYGGSLENRMRFQLEIVQGIREKCGPDFVIGFAFVADDYVPGGIVLEDSIRFAEKLEQAGTDYIDVRAGTHETFVVTEQGRGHSKYQPKNGIWEYSEPFKKAVKVPVFCSTSGCYDFVLWEEALRKEQADVVSIAKPFLADEDLPRKILEDKPEEIRQCVMCLSCLDFGAPDAMTSPCAINPEAGITMMNRIKERPKKKVLVVGAGPAGLEAARVAALNGHKVQVMDSCPEPGGNLRIMGLCPGNEMYLRLADWLTGQCRNAGVKFALNKTVDVQAIRKARPDALILATGASEPVLPPIQGINKPHVVTPHDIITGKKQTGDNVVILGGGFIGIDVTVTIVMKKMAKSVTIIEPWSVPTLAYNMSVLNRTYTLFVLLPKYGVQGVKGLSIEQITEKEVIGIDENGKKRKYKADTVVVCLGYSQNTDLYKSLRSESWELHVIGGGVDDMNVGTAIHEGARVARQL
ncbi:MAG: FAD-dependent oxidoreductase [Dehalococcoidales bacterium]|nr:FAD-dependent oxidoreductase [Dehalococcoidales bacterium]